MKRTELARAETIEEARVKADNFRQAHTRVQIRRMRPSGFKIVWRAFENAEEGKAALVKKTKKGKKNV